MHPAVESTAGDTTVFISQEVFTTMFCKSQFPHKSVNTFFIALITKDKMMDCAGTDFSKTTINTLCVVSFEKASFAKETAPILKGEVGSPMKEGKGVQPTETELGCWGSGFMLQE